MARSWLAGSRNQPKEGAFGMDILRPSGGLLGRRSGSTTSVWLLTPWIANKAARERDPNPPNPKFLEKCKNFPLKWPAPNLLEKKISKCKKFLKTHFLVLLEFFQWNLGVGHFWIVFFCIFRGLSGSGDLGLCPWRPDSQTLEKQAC